MESHNNSGEEAAKEMILEEDDTNFA